MEHIDNESKIDLITTVSHKCADILKDPTLGGARELSAEARTIAREDAYDDLLTCIDSLAAIASFNEGFFDIVNIASKLKIEIANDKQ